MKYFFIFALVCNAATLTAMQESAKNLLAKQQYAHQISTLESQLDCAINHANAFSYSLLTLSGQAHIAYTPNVHACMLEKISGLRGTHAQLNSAYSILRGNSLAQHYNQQLNVLSAALVVLNNHIETAAVHDSMLNQCAQNAAAPVSIHSR